MTKLEIPAISIMLMAGILLDLICFLTLVVVKNRLAHTH